MPLGRDFSMLTVRHPGVATGAVAMPPPVSRLKCRRRSWCDGISYPRIESAKTKFIK